VNPVLYFAVRALVGGSLVAIFAVIGEVVQPKRLAGVFGAAPSVALSNLALIAAVEGVPKAIIESRGMIGGAAAMVVACIAGVFAVRRLRALRGAVALCLVWVAVAVAARLLIYR
jgi:hypothetical protein